MSKLTEVDPYQQFLRDLFHNDDEDLSLLQAEAKSEGIPGISIGPEQGKFLQLLVQMTGARKVLEIGVLGGYSGTWIARALPDGGKLIGLELEQRHADFAHKQWQRMGLADKIEVRVGPALESLPHLAEEAPFDLVFIDADKTNYLNYYVKCIDLLSPRGVIAVDNTLWGGKVLDPKDESDKAIAALNDYVTNDPRVNNVLLTLRDGLMLAFRA